MIGIIPAAGKGVRLKELGRIYPKAMLPYKEKPIIIHSVRWMFEQGASEVRIVVNHQREKIQEAISRFLSKEEANKVAFYYQDFQKGLSSAILSALEPNDADSVLVVLGDILPEGNSYDRSHNWISVDDVNDYSRWCMVDVDCSGVVKKFYDKPDVDPKTRTAVSGVYFFLESKQLYRELLEQQKIGDTIKGEFQISTVLEKFIPGLKAYSVPGVRDFGTLEDYLKSTQQSIVGSRGFNNLIFHLDLVEKQSKYRQKIIDEYNWYRTIPEMISVYTPKIFDLKHLSSYTMEKIKAPTLKEIYLFLDSSEELWHEIFEEVFSLVSRMNEIHSTKIQFMPMMIEKTRTRIEESDLTDEEEVLASRLIDYLKERSSVYEEYETIIHGDLCFSNMLYYPQTKSLKIIDPRGSLFGSRYYDLAKLCHSVLFSYDFIVSDLYVENDGEFIVYDDGKESIRKMFLEYIRDRYIFSDEEFRYLMAITASLFLSMLPLHSDKPNHQKMFLSIFRRICKDYVFTP